MQKKSVVEEQTKAPFNLEEHNLLQDEAKKINTFFTKKHKKGQFNGNILFAKDGKIIIKKTYGYSDCLKKTALEIDSKFQLASVSKQFTAFAIIKLKEKGYLNFNDPVSKHIPNFPYKNITIHHLLTHRSGLANYNYFSEKFWKNKSKPMTNKALEKIMHQNKGLYYTAPGKQFNYCNTNYALLASIVEHVTGMSYKEYMETQIFKPLHMYNTKVFSFNDSANISKKAKGHEAGHYAAYNYQDEITGDKGIFSTVEDMFIWDQYLHSEMFLSQDAIAKAFEPGGNWRGSQNYGYGWRLLKKKNDSDYYTFHFGWWHGFRSYFIRLPNNQGTIIVLNNSMRGGFLRLTDLVALLD